MGLYDGLYHPEEYFQGFPEENFQGLQLHLLYTCPPDPVGSGQGGWQRQEVPALADLLNIRDQ